MQEEIYVLATLTFIYAGLKYPNHHDCKYIKTNILNFLLIRGEPSIHHAKYIVKNEYTPLIIFLIMGTTTTVRNGNLNIRVTKHQVAYC